MLLVAAAHAADVLDYSERFDAYSTSSFSGTAGWVSGYSLDSWSTLSGNAVYALTDDSTGVWGDGLAADNHLVYTGQTWSDARLTTGLYSNDDDAIGVVFRYQDASNFYVMIRVCG